MFMQDNKLDRIQHRNMELPPALVDFAAALAIMDFEQDDNKD